MKDKFIAYVDKLLVDIDNRLSVAEYLNNQMLEDLNTIKTELILVKTYIEKEDYSVGSMISYGYIITDHWSLDDELGDKLLNLKHKIIKYNKTNSLMLKL